MRKNSFLFLVLIFHIILCTFCFAHASTYEASSPKQYDGVWFLGFNMHKDIFSDANGLNVRRAFITAIDRDWIVKNLVRDDIVPVGMIPPGMQGYDPGLRAYPFDPSKAKRLMSDAGYPTTDKRLKAMTLLHTDGVLTVEIAKWIKRYLISLGVDLQLVQVKYSDYSQWESAIKSGKYNMFLMGYKPVLFNQVFVGDRDTKLFHTIDCEKMPSAEATVFFPSYDEALSAGFSPDPICKPYRKEDITGFDLLDPLFNSEGADNLTFFSSSRIDSILNSVAEMSPMFKSDREEKTKELSKILLDDPPAMPIFYITRL
jgi:ABC-type transport system substrate-binding protein